MKEYYVYLLLRPDGDHTPCYVGKGTGKRLGAHFKLGVNHYNRRLANIFRRSAKIGQPVGKKIVFRTYDEREALAKEVELIVLYGPDTLCNLTSGGESPVVSDESRAKMSAFQRTRKLSPEHRAKISAANKGRIVSDENKAKRSAYMRATMADPEKSAMMKERSCAALRSLEVRSRLSEALRGNQFAKGRVLPPESIERIRVSKLGKPRSPETCAKISASRKAMFARRRAEQASEEGS